MCFTYNIDAVNDSLHLMVVTTGPQIEAIKKIPWLLFDFEAEDLPFLPPFSLPNDMKQTDRWLLANLIGVLEALFFSEPFLIYLKCIFFIIYEFFNTDSDRRPSFSKFFACSSEHHESALVRLRSPSSNELVPSYKLIIRGIVLRKRLQVKGTSTSWECIAFGTTVLTMSI